MQTSRSFEVIDKIDVLMTCTTWSKHCGFIEVYSSLIGEDKCYLFINQLVETESEATPVVSA